MKLAKVNQEVGGYIQSTKNVDVSLLEAKEDDLLSKLMEWVQDQVINCFKRDFGEEYITPLAIESLLSWREHDYNESFELFFGLLWVSKLDKVKFENVIENYLNENANKELYKNFLQRRQEMYN